MEYDSKKYLVWTSYFGAKSFDRKIIGKTWVMYKDVNKGKNQQKIPLHYIYYINCCLKPKPKNGPPGRRQVIR